MIFPRFRPAAALAALLLSGAPLAAQVVNGPVRVVDGDTLDFTGTQVVLAGIDAPEAKQTCERAGAVWPCGEEAKALLGTMTLGAEVTCEGLGRDGAGTLVARCLAGESDLSQGMVAAGLAIALPGSGEGVTGMEGRARRFALGIWAGTFEEPAKWRAAHPAAAPRPAAQLRTAPARERVYRNEFGCAIKGNQSMRGPRRNIPGPWIYHLPGMPHYDATRAEAFFCTESEAQGAGYRRSKDR